MKKILSIFIAGSIFVAGQALAVRSFKSDPVKRVDINTATYDALNEINLPNSSIVKTIYARGIQSYERQKQGWKGVGPLADLYPVRARKRQNLDKIGFHYMHQGTPAWNLPVNGVDTELVAMKATAIPGASDEDVAWLHVELQPNDAGITDILRIHTRAGLAPSTTNYVKNHRVGSGYETLYVLISR